MNLAPHDDDTLSQAAPPTRLGDILVANAWVPRDTVENARFSKTIANPKPGERWLLVTSAYHMPRSIGSFRGAGFVVEAYPVDWRTRGSSDLLRPFTNVGDGLRRTDTAMREWVGLVIYRAAGYMPELFPGTAQGGCDTAGAIDRCRR